MIAKRLESICEEELYGLLALNSHIQGKAKNAHDKINIKISNKVLKEYPVKISVCKSNMIIACDTVTKSR